MRDRVKNIITSQVIFPDIAVYVLKSTMFEIPNRLVTEKAIKVFIIATTITMNISLTLDI